MSKTLEENPDVPEHVQVFGEKSLGENPERTVEKIEAIKQLSDQAKRILLERFGRGGTHSEREYHNLAHSLSVCRRAVKIMDELIIAGVSVDPNEYRLIQLMGMYHDIMQNKDQKPVILEDESSLVALDELTAKRNEKADILKSVEQSSANELVEAMRGKTDLHGETLFTNTDEEIVREGILMTEVYFDKKLGTVTQLIPENAHMSGIVLALADVGTAGMDGACEYLSEGHRLAVESNPELKKVNKRYYAGTTLFTNVKNETAIRQIIASGFEKQVTFAMARKAEFPKRIALLCGADGTCIDTMERAFDKFDESIKAAQLQLEQLDEYSTEELVTTLSRAVI